MTQDTQAGAGAGAQPAPAEQPEELRLAMNLRQRAQLGCAGNPDTLSAVGANALERQHAELLTARAEAKHWRCNHDNVAAQLRVFTQRPDIPKELADRLPWYRELVRLQAVEAQAACGAAPLPTVELVGIKDGQETSLGPIAMPPTMKARDLLREYGFGDFDDDMSQDSCAMAAMESLIEYCQRYYAAPASPAQLDAPAAQLSRECLQQSAEEVDFLLEDLPPVEGLDVILAEYEKTYGRTPDAAMAATVGKVKNMLLMWWASHREAIAAALQAAPPAPAAVPVLYVSPAQLEKHLDLEGSENAEAGRYLPARKTPAGKFTQPLYALAAAPAQAVAVPAQGVALQAARAGRVYVAGPMTGLPEFNFPAFHAKAAELRASGWHVENPAEHGIVEGASWADYLHYDIGRMATCCAIHLLPGWCQSRGAALEVHIASVLGMEFQYAHGAERYHAPAQEHATQLAGQGQWTDLGYTSAAHYAEDMQAVGEALMEAVKDNYASLQAAGWRPSDSPAEVVVDLLNLLDEAKAAAPIQAQEDAPALEAPAAPAGAYTAVARQGRQHVTGRVKLNGGFFADTASPEHAQAIADAMNAALAAAPQAPASQGHEPVARIDSLLQRDGLLWRAEVTLALPLPRFTDLFAAPQAPAAPAVDAQGERDAAFEAVRNRLCGLQRYSFVLDDDGVVRRAQDRTGNWIEFDDAHELFDPVAVDAAIAAQAKDDAARAAQGGQP